MPSADPAPSRGPRIPALSLRARLLLPLFIILTLLGGAALLGSSQLVRSASLTASNAHLSAVQDVLYREFKRQEETLLTYAVFLEHFQALADRFEHSDEIGILQDRLFTTLEGANIAVSFYPLDAQGKGAIIGFEDLFAQALRSGKPRFRYTNQIGGLPMLVVAAPLAQGGTVHSIMLLQVVMGGEFLARVCKPLGVAATIHSLDGEVLANSGPDATPLQLSSAQLQQLASDGRLFLDHTTLDGEYRHLFTLIPLGTSDMVLLSLESSIAITSATQRTLMIRLGLSIVVALVLGAALYFRLVGSIVRPARELSLAAEAISRGDLGYRILEPTDDEFGTVAVSFNKMAEQLESTYREKAEKDTALALAQQEAMTKSVIERKNREIEKTNDELRSHLREISALYQLNQVMVTASDLSILFDRVVQTISEIMTCDQIVLLAYNPGDSVLEVARAAGLNSETIRTVKFAFDQGITGLAAQGQRQIYVKDVEKDERYLNYHNQAVLRGSFLSTPMVVKGRLMGVLNLHKRDADAFSASELKLAQSIANQVALASDNAQLLEKARDLSNIDDLTGLANRRHFQEILKREMAQSRRFSSVFSILMCDIDNFEEFTAREGRMRGDALLRQVGQALLNNTRGIDLVSRFSNEEFVILLPKTGKAGGVAAAEKLREQILKESPAAGTPGPGGERITVSFGVAEFPSDSKNIYELLNLADRALYAAKKEGSNRTVAWEGPAPAPE